MGDLLIGVWNGNELGNIGGSREIVLDVGGLDYVRNILYSVGFVP